MSTRIAVSSLGLQVVAVLAALPPMQGAAAQQGAADTVRYTVTFDAAEPRLVAVTLGWILRSPTLEIDAEASTSGSPSGGRFVNDLRIETAAGTAVAAAREAPGRWRVDARPGTRLRARYRLRIDHAALRVTGSPVYDWGRTIAEVAWTTRELAFVTGRMLFLTPTGMTRAEAVVQSPPGWRTVSSWGVSEGGRLSLRASRDELREGFVAAGRLELSRHVAGSLALVVATPSAMPSRDRREIRRVAGSSLGRFVRLMGGAPRASLGMPYREVVLLTAAAPALELAGGGLAWKDIVLLAPPGDEPWSPRALAAVAHELFHLWNARAFRYRTPRERWFSEGVAEYLALRALLDEGVIGDDGYRDLMDGAFDRYRHDSWIGENSILRAGDLKFAHRGLVHDGGLLVAACIDADMRRATNGARALDDVLRAMFQRFDAGERTYDTGDVFDLVSELAGDAVARPLQRMVDGTASLGLWRCATERPTR